MKRLFWILSVVAVLMGCSEPEETVVKINNQDKAPPKVVDIDQFKSMKINGPENLLAAKKVKETCMADLPFASSAMEDLAAAFTALQPDLTVTVKDIESLADSGAVDKRVKSACDMGNMLASSSVNAETRGKNVLAMLGVMPTSTVNKRNGVITLSDFPTRVAELYACGAMMGEQKLSDIKAKFDPMIERYRSLVVGKGKVFDAAQHGLMSSDDPLRDSLSEVNVENISATVTLSASGMTANPSLKLCETSMAFLVSQLPVMLEYSEQELY